jgi:hypothetical protein
MEYLNYIHDPRDFPFTSTSVKGTLFPSAYNDDIGFFR